MPTINMQQHIADLGAGISTVSTGFYFIDYLEATALVVAITSGALAAAWHVYRFYKEYKNRKGATRGN